MCYVHMFHSLCNLKGVFVDMFIIWRFLVFNNGYPRDLITQILVCFVTSFRVTEIDLYIGILTGYTFICSVQCDIHLSPE
jgi:hypothetical protein